MGQAEEDRGNVRWGREDCGILVRDGDGAHWGSSTSRIHGVDPPRELVGQGLGNITASMFQGCVVAGSFARSAVNWKLLLELRLMMP